MPAQIILERRFRLSINRRLIDKNEGNDTTLFRTGWESVALKPAELAFEIDRGVAFTCELAGDRNAANFVCFELLSVDMDGSRTIEDVKADPFIEKHLTIFYTTASHTPENHRFRLVFALPRPIATPQEMRAAYRSLALKLGGDRSATDPARLFFGCRGSRPEVYNRSIPTDVLDELIAHGANADQRDGALKGYLHYPNGEYRFDGRLPETRSHWVNFTKTEARVLLEAWDSVYIEKDLGDDRGKALVLKGSKVALTDYDPTTDRVVELAAKKAQKRRDAGNWPNLYFRDDKSRQPGRGRPRLKNYIETIKEGKVPTTFWDEDQYDDPIQIGSVTWPHAVSGHTDLAKRELDQIVGRDHGFDTVKPLRLMKKIIQIWCPKDGLVMDPYAGSGTTGHAVLELNAESSSVRRFVLIEQGAPDRGDKYARSLTQVRLAHAVTGKRPSSDGQLKRIADPLPGGFQFRQLTQKIDSRAVLTMKKDELIDLVITSHWENTRRGSASLIRLESEGFKYLVGRNDQNEGYFLIWNGGDKVGQLDETSYATVIAEGKKAGLKQPYHVYARYEVYQSRNVIFYKIPDRILAHLGLNESSDSFNEEGDA